TPSSTRATPRPGSVRARRCSTPPPSSRRRRNRPQLLHLEGLELAPGAGLEPLHRERAVPAAMELGDAAADGLEHAADLAGAPVVSASSLPTGTTRAECGTRPMTVGRPCGSCAVVTTPAGLLSST